MNEDEIETPQSISRKLAVEYHAFCCAKTGNNFLSINVPKPGSVLEAGCVKLWDWLKENGIKPHFYWELANSLFTEAWVKKTFKAPYVPFSLAIGMKGQVIDRWKEPLLGQEDAEAERLKKIVMSFKPETRKVVLEHGMGWVSKDLRRRLLE